MEKRVTELRREVDAKKNELSEAKETLNSITNGHEDPVLTVENEISQVKFQINETQRSLTESVEEQNSTIDRDEQIRMWQSLQKIFELKLKILQNPGSVLILRDTEFFLLFTVPSDSSRTCSRAVHEELKVIYVAVEANICLG
uniref:Golgin subfamily A member 5 n=1 Tax=Syphacia muris TaxID=451379 RepID=A0A0N5AZJ6_9BILA